MNLLGKGRGRIENEVPARSWSSKIFFKLPIGADDSSVLSAPMAFLTTVVAFSSAFYASRAGTIRCSEATAATTVTSWWHDMLQLPPP